MDKTNQDQEILLLKEILKWIKFAGMNQVKAVLINELQTDEEKIVYHKSDGTKGTVELGKLVGMGNATVARKWEKWQKMGLGESIPVAGGSRFKRSFDLEEFGIKVSEKKENNPIVNPKLETKVED
jgi:hypothetical protein